MALSKEPTKNVDFNDKKVKDFLSGGAPVIEDIKQEEDDLECQLVTMRVPKKFLKEIDEAVKRGYTNRTAWIFGAIQERLMKLGDYAK